MSSTAPVKALVTLDVKQSKALKRPLVGPNKAVCALVIIANAILISYSHCLFVHSY